MAIDTYDVSVDLVIGKLPIDPSTVTETSQPLSLTDIENYIAEGAAEINAAMINASINPATDAVSRSQCATATMAYAIAEALSTMGMAGTQMYRDMRDRWKEVEGSLRAKNTSETSASKVFTNWSGRNPEWRGKNFRGF